MARRAISSPDASGLEGAARRRRRRQLAAVALLLLAVAIGIGLVLRTPGVPGVDTRARAVAVGILGALTGPEAPLGRPLARGFETAFEHLNAHEGGVGRHLPPEQRYALAAVIRDTQGSASVAVHQYQAIRAEVLFVGSSFGVEPTGAILEDLRADGAPAIPTHPAAEWSAEPLLLPAVAPPGVHAANAVAHLAEATPGDSPRIGVVVEGSPEVVEAARVAARASGIPEPLTAALDPRVGDQTPAVEELLAGGVETVIVQARPRVAASLLDAAEALGEAGARLRWILPWTAWAEPVAAHRAAAEGRVLVLADPPCSWGDRGPPCAGMIEAAGAREQYAPDQGPSLAFALGYAHGLLAREVVERALAAGTLTREGVAAAVASFDRVDLAGLLPSFALGEACEERIPSRATSVLEIATDAPTGLTLLARVESDPARDLLLC